MCVVNHLHDSLSPDAIVCLDACFTQKRNKGERDPPRTHPKSVFIPEVETVYMEDHWENICGGSQSKNSRPSRRARVDMSDEEDGYEGHLQVLTSVLDGCEASFTAADAAREKASTQFFDDTALMALLCRHNRVLWIVNM